MAKTPIAPEEGSYLYHAAPCTVAGLIIEGGLQPRSGKKDGSEPLYLCMSAKESGATTLRRQGSDIIFRVLFSTLDKSWKKTGAGSAEWRGYETLDKSRLEFRRYLGTAAQKKWKPASAWNGTGR